MEALAACAKPGVAQPAAVPAVAGHRGHHLRWRFGACAVDADPGDLAGGLNRPAVCAADAGDRVQAATSVGGVPVDGGSRRHLDRGVADRQQAVVVERSEVHL
jgi:hypothetical protein